MADAFTTRGGIIKPEVGQHLDTWGDLWNNNGTDMIDKGLFGFQNISVTTDFALTSTNGDSTSTQLNKAIQFGGNPTADFNVTFLSKEQVIRFVNSSGRNATVKVSAGTGVTLAAGDIADLGYNATLGDVTNVSVNRIAGNMTVGGAIQVAGKITNLSPGIQGTDAINLTQLSNALAAVATAGDGSLLIQATDSTRKFLNSAIAPSATGGITTLVVGGSGANQTLNILLAINAMTAYTAPVDADVIPAYDSVDAGHRKITLNNLLVGGWPTIPSAADADSFLALQSSTGLLKKVARSGIFDEGQAALVAGTYGL